MTYILILIGCYFGLWAALSACVTSHRRDLAAFGAALQNRTMDQDEREFVNNMLASAYSWRSAIMLCLVYIIGLFQAGATLDKECDKFASEHPTLSRDAHLHGMVDAYFASVAAVNPIFGALAFVLKRIFRLKARLYHSAQSADKIADFRGLNVAV